MSLLHLTIARRYLLGKKSHNAVNIISGVAVAGIAVAVAAMVVVLSVFNGFRELVQSLYSAFDSELCITPAEGKYFTAGQADSLARVFQQSGKVEALSRTVEDQALILFRGHPQVITLKGVDDRFADVSQIRSILYGDGIYQFHRAGVEYAIPGFNLGQMMGGPNFSHMQICAPRGGERINLADPLENLSVAEINSTGLLFSVNQPKYDNHYLLVSLQLAQQLFEKEGQCTALELRLKPQSEAEVKALCPPSAVARNRYEQQSELLGIMEIEKLLAYVFLSFILVVACFNIVSSISMLIMEKRADAHTLSHLGMTQGGLRSIFLLEGQLITLTGTVIGLAVGSALCLAQQAFGLVKLGTGENFIVQDYPVSLHPLDLVFILITALLIGGLATLWPVMKVKY